MATDKRTPKSAGSATTARKTPAARAAGARARAPAAKPLTTSAKLDLLAHRLNALEMVGSGAGATESVPAPDQRTIGFTVSNATATTRISELDAQGHAQVVVSPGATTGDSAPHDDNTLVDIIVELSGSAGNSADVAFTNTDVDKIHPVIPNDYTGSWYAIQYTLKTKW
jgi:hypothetical protein